MQLYYKNFNSYVFFFFWLIYTWRYCSLKYVKYIFLIKKNIDDYFPYEDLSNNLIKKEMIVLYIDIILIFYLNW